MHTVQLGRTDLMVSRLCFGTMTFGLQADEDGSRSILDAAAGGLLTGKHRYDAVPDDGSRFTTGARGGVYRGLYWRKAEFHLRQSVAAARTPLPADLVARLDQQ